MSQASNKQIGGDHYKAMGEFQPWDVLQHWLTPEEYKGYQKGVAIAYLARERAKGGDQDIAKAAHHLQKLLEVLQESKPVEKATEPAPDADGWIDWAGGDCPPVYADTEVWIKLRDGSASDNKRKAEYYNWRHHDKCYDIIKYRIAKP